MSDHERPLNKRGRNAAPRIGRLLVDSGMVPDLMLCSTAQRARETSDLVISAAKCGEDTPINYLDELYLAPPSAYYKMLNVHAGEADMVMVIGHNPGLENLIDELTNEPVTMPTAALARIEVESWQELVSQPVGRLVGHWLVRDLEE